MIRIFLSVLAAASLPFLAPLAAQTDTGLAGSYSDAFIGRPTASGEIYDPEAFTASHRTLRFGIRLRVTNPSNGKAVTVRVNDRGPSEGRLLDLSRAAASSLGLLSEGTVEVRVLRAEEEAVFPPTPSLETYFQMGAFRTEANAQSLARTLVRQGYAPRIKKEGTLYRVFLTVAEPGAAELAAKLTKEGRNGFLQISREPPGTLLNLSTE